MKPILQTRKRRHREPLTLVTSWGTEGAWPELFAVLPARLAQLRQELPPARASGAKLDSLEGRSLNPASRAPSASSRHTRPAGRIERRGQGRGHEEGAWVGVGQTLQCLWARVFAL